MITVLLFLSGIFAIILGLAGISEGEMLFSIILGIGILNIVSGIRIHQYRKMIKQFANPVPAAPVPAPVPAAPAKLSVDHMTGVEFEDFCSRVLEGYGFVNISKTPVTGDHGIDLIAWKSGKKYAIQCKRYKAKVNNKAIQEAYTGKQLYAAAEAVVMTSSDFTDPAKKEAAEVGVTLWNREIIKHMMEMADINDVSI